MVQEGKEMQKEGQGMEKDAFNPGREWRNR